MLDCERRDVVYARGTSSKLFDGVLSAHSCEQGDIRVVNKVTTLKLTLDGTSCR